MKGYKGESPFTHSYWRRPIAGRTDVCKLLCIFYFKETRKRFSFVLPGVFEIKELDKLDSKGHIKTPGDYDVKTYSRLFYWAFYAACGIRDLEASGVEVKDFTKGNLSEAINSKLKEGGVI